MPSRFLIMSLPRCGSTTLMNVLNCHPDIRCLREPFNPDQAGNTYLGRVHDLGSLDVVLRHIWRCYNGVKHVWEPSGWPFGRGMGFNLALAMRPDVRILLLTRTNHLQRIVSFSQLLTSHGVLVIKNAQYAEDQEPPESGCGCYTCRHFSRAYLRHLFMAGEMTSGTLNTIHNLYFYIDLMRRIREAISFGAFERLRSEFHQTFSRRPHISS